MSNLMQRLRENVAQMRDNEDGAETLEILVFLVIFVLGMAAVWIGIRNKAADRGDDIQDCLNNASSRDQTGC